VAAKSAEVSSLSEKTWRYLWKMPYKDGKKWRATIMLNGKRFQRVFKTQAEAKKWEVVEKEKITRCSGQIPEHMELRIFCSKYLDYSKAHHSKKVFDEKLSLVHRIVDRWGKPTPIGDISVDMIATYIEEQAEVRSHNAANKDRKNLLAIWNWGIKRLNINNNPVTKVDKLAHDRKSQYTPPEKDILRMLAAADREERIFLDCFLNTGARKSEILRLQWNDDVNFEKRKIRLGTRKTKDGSMSYKWLPMNKDLCTSLKWLWDNRKFNNSPYVFVNNKPGANFGKPFKYRNRFMKGLCKRAGVKPFGFHAMRRFVASILADKHKLSAKSIQEILRHNSVTTTELYIQNINNDTRTQLDLLSKNDLPADLPQNKKGSVAID